MKTIKFLITAILISTMFSGCTFISNSFDFKSKTETFVNAILAKNYDKCISLMTFPVNAHPNNDTLKAQFANLNNMLVSHFGDKLNYTFVSAQKIFTTDNSGSTPEGQTLAFIQIDNSSYVGEVKLMFDDKTLKVTSFYVMDVYEQKGTMLYYWLFGVLVLGVLAFNI